MNNVSGLTMAFLRLVNYLRSIVNGWFIEWNMDFALSQRATIIIMVVIVFAGYAFFAKSKTVVATRIGFVLWSVIVFGSLIFGMFKVNNMFQ